jgi:radical SAM protein with 4Fe4S-binding SPASM domain
VASPSLALLGEAAAEGGGDGSSALPHVVAWNLTRRCNLECAHCYIAAGPQEAAVGELTTAECLRIADEILAVNPAPLFILSGGEPLLRDDLEEIARYAHRGGATVVVGTNGTLLTDDRIARLQAAGVTGVAVSVESLRSEYHDRFRHGHGSLEATRAAVERLGRHGLDFIIQTTLTRGNRRELADLVAWAADCGAVAFNAYFLVAAGRGARLTDLSPVEYEEALAELVDLHLRYLGRMMVRAKCAPHFMRLVHRRAPDSPVLNYRTRCPCGIDYCRVTPDGKLTACPFLPVPAGDLRQSGFEEVWRRAPLFQELRRGALGGKCGRCEYRDLCGGCRARAFGESGDYLAEDPSCTYQPDGTIPLVAPRAVTYGAPAVPRLTWSQDAEQRMARIPSFVRAVVVERVERYARSRGRTEVTPELLAEVRRALPVDFSKRLPFFLRHDH